MIGGGGQRRVERRENRKATPFRTPENALVQRNFLSLGGKASALSSSPSLRHCSERDKEGFTKAYDHVQQSCKGGGGGATGQEKRAISCKAYSPVRAVEKWSEIHNFGE